MQLDVTYTTPLQSQAMMEPHATLAMWDGDSLILHTSNQMLSQGRDAVAIPKLTRPHPTAGQAWPLRRRLARRGCHASGEAQAPFTNLQ